MVDNINVASGFPCGKLHANKRPLGAKVPRSKLTRDEAQPGIAVNVAKLPELSAQRQNL